MASGTVTTAGHHPQSTAQQKKETSAIPHIKSPNINAEAEIYILAASSKWYLKCQYLDHINWSFKSLVLVWLPEC